MFLGIRDILFAKGRFALIGSVVGLITLLLVMLTGLTGGLGSQNTKAIEDLHATRMVFGTSGTSEPEVSYTNSTISDAQAQQWADAPGVNSSTPVGFTQGNLEANSATGIAVMGIPTDSSLVADNIGSDTGDSLKVEEGKLIISHAIADKTGAKVGDTVTVSGQQLTVQAISHDTFYSHTPVAWTSTGTWQQLAHVAPNVVGTALAVTGDADYDALASATHAVTATPKESFTGLVAYSSENKSLVTMQGFLYGISALVTVSFLTVWTIQRTRDIAVMRALGASGKYLVKDAIFQAAVVLAVGAALGALVGWVLGALAAGAVPFQLEALTIAGPAFGIWVLGIAGAFVAVRRVSKIDPMIALGGN